MLHHRSIHKNSIYKMSSFHMLCVRFCYFKYRPTPTDWLCSNWEDMFILDDVVWFKTSSKYAQFETQSFRQTADSENRSKESFAEDARRADSVEHWKQMYNPSASRSSTSADWALQCYFSFRFIQFSFVSVNFIFQFQFMQMQCLFTNI